LDDFRIVKLKHRQYLFISIVDRMIESREIDKQPNKNFEVVEASLDTSNVGNWGIGELGNWKISTYKLLLLILVV